MRGFAPWSGATTLFRGEKPIGIGTSKSFDWKVCHLVKRESIMITEYEATDVIEEDQQRMSAGDGVDKFEQVSGFGDYDIADE